MLTITIINLHLKKTNRMVQFQNTCSHQGSRLHNRYAQSATQEIY